MEERRGQGLVEFALLIPVLLLVLLGLVEAALLVQGYVTVQHAAREAARFAVTYQPLQGACVDADEDGQIEMGDGLNADSDDLAAYPFCPRDHAGWPGEPDADYYRRRIVLIKKEAVRAAAGLRISFVGDTDDTWEAYKHQPGFFGVKVWGFPSFLTDCNDPQLSHKRWDPADTDPGCYDHPGLEGLPVRVMVAHNVEIVDPLYRIVVEFVPVWADTQMVNEGIQVGFGGMPVPAFEWGAGGPGGGGNGTPVVVTPVVTATPVVGAPAYFVNLLPKQATNDLPGNRGHVFVATVTNEEDQGVQGASVSFSATVGGFSYSGANPKYVEETTDAQGQAPVTLFGNQPGTASLRAWIDNNGNDTWDGPLEPSDVATKTWTVSGPYITVSSHEVIPLDGIHIDVMDHSQGDDPHRLLWCVVSGTTPSAVVMDTLYVGADGDATELSFTIPQGAEGTYQLESYRGSGSDGCGAADVVACSADVHVTAVPPDLRILGISWPEEYGDVLPVGTSIPFTMVVENHSPTPVEGADVYFDVDYYLDLPYPPPFQGQVGVHKQWLQGIGPYEMQAVNAAFEFSPGEHYMYGQVDTSDYVADESDEDNNVSEPYTLTARCPIHDEFDDGLVDPDWTRTGVGGAGGSVSETGDGWLRIRADGSGISGSSDDFYYLYRSVSGDFDARLRIVSVPQCNPSSAMGLMVRDLATTDSRHVSVLQTRDHGVQFVHRHSSGGGTFADYVSNSGEVWVRIVRSGDTFDYYFSTAGDPGEDDWTYHSSVTVNMSDPVLVGIAHAAHGSCHSRNSYADEMMICPPVAAPEVIHPPGLIECQQLLRVGGFEGNQDTVFEHWNAGESLAFQHQSRYFYDGSMSMRLHASLGSYPDCPAYHPYLWQAVEIPREVYTMTTLTVRGQRLVAGSLAPCSHPDTPEADDVLYLKMRDGGGSDLSTGTVVVTGGIEVTRTWEAFAVDVTSVVNPYDHPGEEVQVYFYADHDEDYYDTWFYLDALECQACTEWPIPDDVPGTATIGGEVRVLVSGFPQRLQGVDVWAYKPGSEVLHTVTIQEGRYHFYNVEPGTYTIYAEIWMGGGLHFVTTTVTVGADERRDDVDLFLP